MENSILKFSYKGQNVEIQCKRNENLTDIFKKYTNKINKDINNIYFINNGNIIKNYNIKVEKIINKENKLAILVYDINNNNERMVKNEKEKYKN